MTDATCCGMPAVGLRGIMRIYTFKDVWILAGAGVGGGSLVYANTLCLPGAAFFAAPEWSELKDWQRSLEPHYAEARRMLGATSIPFRTDADDLLRLVGQRMGVGDSYQRPEVSVFFGDDGEAGITFGDPYFTGQGPSRTACTRCGACMIGCRVGAKNTLVKNYLYFAERDPSRADGQGDPPAGGRGRLGRVRHHLSPFGRLVAQAT